MILEVFKINKVVSKGCKCYGLVGIDHKAWSIGTVEYVRVINIIYNIYVCI